MLKHLTPGSKDMPRVYKSAVILYYLLVGCLAFTVSYAVGYMIASAFWSLGVVISLLRSS